MYYYLLAYMNIGIYNAIRSLLLSLSVMTHINTQWLVHCSQAILSPPPVASISFNKDGLGKSEQAKKRNNRMSCKRPVTVTVVWECRNVRKNTAHTEACVCLIF